MNVVNIAESKVVIPVLLFFTLELVEFKKDITLAPMMDTLPVGLELVEFKKDITFGQE